MSIGSLADLESHWTGQQIAAEVQRALGAGLKAAAIFLAARVREEVSVPAPRVRVTARRGKLAGVKYYRATAPATKGAPPRKLSGQFRSKVTWEMDAAGLEGRVGTNAVQGRRLEQEGHPYLVPALRRFAGELGQIIAGARP